MPVVPGTLPVLEIRPMGQTKGDDTEIMKNAFGLSKRLRSDRNSTDDTTLRAADTYLG